VTAERLVTTDPTYLRYRLILAVVGVAQVRSVRGSPATIHPYRVMNDHPPVDDPDPMAAQLPRSELIIFKE
jgi:hypothetical protein